MTEHVCIRIQGGEVFCRCGWFGKANYGTAIMTLYGDHRAAAEREAWQARLREAAEWYDADHSTGNVGVDFMRGYKMAFDVIARSVGTVEAPPEQLRKGQTIGAGSTAILPPSREEGGRVSGLAIVSALYGLAFLGFFVARTMHEAWQERSVGLLGVCVLVIAGCILVVATELRGVDG